MNICVKTKELYKKAGQAIGGYVTSPSRSQIQFTLFAAGVMLLTVGMLHGAHASTGDGNDMTSGYDDGRIANSVTTILAYLEGSFGALVMVVSGIGAILSAAFGQYKAALGCLVVAVGAFILRSFMHTFFNVESIDSSGQTISGN
jgi:type IV secretory pathway VirB2 component (pilin)